MSNVTGMLYTGVTNDLVWRVYQHKTKAMKGFTSQYNIKRLVHFESTNDVSAAIAREKQIKGWVREKKVDLINATNPEWRDLSADWMDISG